MNKLTYKIVVLLTSLTIVGSSLCGNKNKSCTNQLWSNISEPLEMCRVIYYKLNSAECASLNFQHKTDSHVELDDVEDVQLIAYVSEEYNQPLFNVTFTNIMWKKAIIRFSKIEYENDKNMCIMFKIWENVTVSKTSLLSYNCPWSREDYEGESFTFEYEFGLPVIVYRKFIFRVPVQHNFRALTKIHSLEIFCYVDVTSSDYLTLHIQTANPRYNITNYLVEVIRERSNVSTRLTAQILNGKEAINGELVFPYPTWNEFGYFYFNVSPINDICKENECLKTSTPKEFIGRRKSSLVIGIVGASVILFALFYAMFFWNRKKNNKENITPRVLLVYNATVNAHCNVVRNLAQLLQDVFHIEVLLDVLDIPQTNHKDPLLWCSHAFRYATHIIYIASPEACKAKSENIYKIYGTAIKFIRRDLACTRSTKQIVVITFPYSANLVPNEMMNLRRFNLMKDMDTFINALIMPPYQSWTFLQIYRPNRFRGEPQYIDLITSIHTAQKEVEMLPEYLTSPITQTPKITVTENSVGSPATVDDTSEDEEMLLKTDENCCFHVSDLNLSGSASSVCQPVVTPMHDYKMNLQDLPL